MNPQAGCRCPRARHTDPEKCWLASEFRRRYRLKAYGQWVYPFVDACGTRRRVQALMTLGWPIAAQAEMAGISSGSQLARDVRECATVSRATAERIAALYDRLWDKPPVGTCKAENIAISMTKARAARGGYAPPLAYDDGSIDDPEAEPYRDRYVHAADVGLDEIAIAEAMRGRPVRLTSAERAEAVQRMTARGYSAQVIAERLNVTQRCVVRRRTATATGTEKVA